ncbi:MAG: hypothetical protein GX434_00005 [Peptococcaceae bacterium]|nr:hypothetical protein [Peptococcaceae bacterium]
MMDKDFIESVLESVGLESLRKNKQVTSEKAKLFGKGLKIGSRTNKRGIKNAKKIK